MEDRQTKSRVLSRWGRWVRRFVAANPVLSKIVSNTGWLVFEKVLNKGVRFFVGVWVVRYLGPEAFGTYSFGLSFVGIFMAFSTLGLNEILVRNLSRQGREDGEILGTALVLRSFGGVATMGVVAVTIGLIQDSWTTQLVVLLLSFQLVLKGIDVFDYWFKSEIQSKYPVIVRSIVTVMYAGGQVACIMLGLSVEAFAALVAIQLALQTAGIYVAFRLVREEQPNWTVSRTVAWDMMADAWPLIIAGLSVSVYMKVDQVMLGQMVGDTEVGIYATAVKISELWYFIPITIASSVFPKIVSMRENVSDGVYEERMQALYDGMALLAYAIIIPMTFLAGPIVELLFGNAYSASAPVLQVHVWAFLFVALGVARGRWLVAENLTRFSMVSTLIGALANLAINYVLIPSFESNGAAWATLLSYSVSVWGTLLLMPNLRKTFVMIGKSLLVPFRAAKVFRNYKKIILK